MNIIIILVAHRVGVFSLTSPIEIFDIEEKSGPSRSIKSGLMSVLAMISSTILLRFCAPVPAVITDALSLYLGTVKLSL